MLKYNCIIIEDEPLAAEILVDYVAQVPFLDLKGVCTDAIYAMEILQTEKVDLIFLDIHLPKLKGMDFLESLKTPPAIIVTSAYKDYAIQAFEVDVIDYLLKPIRFNRFLKAVNKVNQVQRVAMPMSVSAGGVERKFMYFNVGKKKVKVYMDEILYVESFREYVKVITGDKSIITKCQLNEMEALLSKEDFLRIHRSFIVSKDKITAFTATDVEINAKPIPIGRSYKDAVMAAFRNTCLWVLLCVFGVVGAHAQSLTERGFPPCKLITHFSFELLSGGIMVVKANLDDFPDTLNFIMDTGSGGVSLDSTTAARFKLVSTLSDKLIHGIAGVKRVRYIYHHTLHFPGLTVSDLDFHTNDYTILSQVYGMQIDGIIGYSFLRRYVLEIDSDSLVMSVYTPGVYKYPSGGFMLKPDFTTLPIVQVAFRDDHRSNGTFYFDTGGGLCFLMSQRYARDSAILDKKRKLVTAMAEGLGGSAQMSLTVVNAVHIGPYVFHKVPTYILDDRYNATAYPSVEGLIGNDLLRRFNLVINYPFMEIYLVPNSHFKDAFDYSYTGMNIYYIDGKIMIMEIEKGSPADEAGLEVGDELFGLDNNFSHNIQTYKNLLENADSKLHLLVMRNGQPRMLTLRTGRIY